jgi:hypothetical protein
LALIQGEYLLWNRILCREFLQQDRKNEEEGIPGIAENCFCRAFPIDFLLQQSATRAISLFMQQRSCQEMAHVKNGST